MSSDPEGSIESRLNGLLALLLLPLLAALLLIGLRLAWLSSLEFVATRLAHDGEALLSRIDPLAGQLNGELPGIYQQPLSGHYLVIRFSQDRLLRSRSLWDETLQLPPVATGTQTTLQLAGPRQQQLLLWSAGFSKDGKAFSLHVAEDISALHQRFRRLLAGGVVLALAAVIALLLVQRVVLRRSFRALDRLRQQLGEITAGQRQHLDAPIPSEIHPLVVEFNQLLASLQAHLGRTRHAAGNLAHALKAPLQRIHYLGQQQGDTQMQQQVAQMRYWIDRELHRARLAGSALAGIHFVPRRDLADLMDSIEQLYADKQLVLEWDWQGDEQLPLDQDDMIELLGNLLDNAAKWAKSRIRLRLTQADSELWLRLQDDGPGLKPEQTEMLKQRGKRLDELSEGHGLGLAIVSDMVDSYGGRFDMGRSEALGGLQTDIRLPLRPSASP